MTFYRPITCAFVCTLVSLAAAPTTHAAGFAKSANFKVLTPDLSTRQETNEYAERILRSAELWRSEIARTWLGGELPTNAGHTIINVTFRTDRDAGLTWAIDHPQRQAHTVYLSTSPELAIGSTLAHEMAHVVLATQFPHPRRLPSWLEEGIASRYDDDARKELRVEELKHMLQTRRRPEFGEILNASNIAASDIRAYTLAASLINLLLRRDSDPEKLFAFGLYGDEHGWDAALKKHYGIAGVDRLGELWQQEVLRAAAPSSELTARASRRSTSRNDRIYR